ncbi:carboxypeptidase-like regulatory domain-containing protein [uncultured Psychroserpens sp.]|uniref:carboxypeptidase-like regulatory domain-containing protein n=1 Tax=uncultured Psychroserpens sp. TaxID=255436 RepID=UPI0026143D18|nr:carboxypeptidase-like regulatory domain-containing protein [uncultured Psychroserpens sp.]
MKISFFSIIFFFVFIALSDAQNTNEIYFKLIDSETSEPISFATIMIKGTTRGVIADYNGEFRIPIQYYNAKNSIIISSIGYTTQDKALINFKTNELNIISIKPQIEALDVVVINNRKARGVQKNANQLVKVGRRMSAKEIVLKAIQNIPKNLSNEPHAYIGYYRDYQLVDNEFHNLNEGIFETFDKGISTNFLEETIDQTVIYNFKRNTNFAEDPELTKAYNGVTKYIKQSEILPRGGNEYTILNTHNPIRNFATSTFSYVYTLEKEFPILHKFSKDKIVYLDDEPIVIISFKKANTNDSYNAYGVKSSRTSYVDGTLYISLVDFSIHRFNYKVVLPRTKKPLFNVSLEYARQNNMMYLNYITFNNAFVISEEFELREEKVEFDNQKQAFYVLFNNTEDYDFLDVNTILNSNFKFKLGKQRLKTVRAEKLSERLVKVEVKQFDGKPISINKDNIEEVTYTFKNIRDVVGREIYKRKSIEGDQFREFFVQEVHIDKSTPEGLKFMAPNLPINRSPVNEFPDANAYWINSPLMKQKYRDEEN